MFALVFSSVVQGRFLLLSSLVKRNKFHCLIFVFHITRLHFATNDRIVRIYFLGCVHIVQQNLEFCVRDARKLARDALAN